MGQTPKPVVSRIIALASIDCSPPDAIRIAGGAGEAVTQASLLSGN